MRKSYFLKNLNHKKIQDKYMRNALGSHEKVMTKLRSIQQYKISQ